MTEREPLDGLRVQLNEAELTIIVISATRWQVDFSFREDPGLTYGVTVAQEHRRAHPERVKALVTWWLHGNPPPGSNLLLSAVDVLGAHPS